MATKHKSLMRLVCKEHDPTKMMLLGTNLDESTDLAICYCPECGRVILTEELPSGTIYKTITPRVFRRGHRKGGKK